MTSTSESVVSITVLFLIFIELQLIQLHSIHPLPGLILEHRHVCVYIYLTVLFDIF